MPQVRNGLGGTVEIGWDASEIRDFVSTLRERGGEEWTNEAVASSLGKTTQTSQAWASDGER